MAAKKMPRIALQYIRTEGGLRLYAPLDAEDARVCVNNVIVCDVKGERSKRTFLQNKSIHKYCALLAEAFNDAGLDMLAVLKVKKVSVSWTMQSVKDVLWRPIQVAMFDKESTTQLETHEVSQVYEQLARHLSENLNVNQSFPNRFGE